MKYSIKIDKGGIKGFYSAIGYSNIECMFIYHYLESTTDQTRIVYNAILY